jgi:hypothetical protein
MNRLSQFPARELAVSANAEFAKVAWWFDSRARALKKKCLYISLHNALRFGNTASFALASSDCYGRRISSRGHDDKDDDYQQDADHGIRDNDDWCDILVFCLVHVVVGPFYATDGLDWDSNTGWISTGFRTLMRLPVPTTGNKRPFRSKAMVCLERGPTNWQSGLIW